MTARPQPSPPRGVSHGRPITGDLRALAAIMMRLDQRPPLRVVASTGPKSAPISARQ